MKKRNVISIIFSQQILSGMLLLVIINEQKSTLNDRFKLELITTYHIRFIVKILPIYYRRNASSKKKKC